jgi:hypothetical protein
VRAVAAGALTLLLAAAAAGQTGGQAPAADAPAGAVRPGAPLDTSGFQYERRLPEGPSELVTLTLDPAALAHSQGPHRNFADVRIVDDRNAQIPYVLEQRSEPLTVELSIGGTKPRVPDLATRGRGTLSFYLINLPYQNLPQPVLTLETAEQVFLRTIELGVQREPDRRHKTEWFESLERVTWQHAVPESPAPPLAIPFHRLDGRELLLIVDEGDNRPLPITGASLRLPGWQLRFFRPAGPLRLLYGRTDLTEPRYDVALLSPSVMSGPAREIVAAPEVTVSRPAALLTPRTFWVGLSVAVVVLLGLIVRLISSGTGTQPSPPGP